MGGGTRSRKAGHLCNVCCYSTQGPTDTDVRQPAEQQQEAHNPEAVTPRLVAFPDGSASSDAFVDARTTDGAAKYPMTLETKKSGQHQVDDTAGRTKTNADG